MSGTNGKLSSAAANDTYRSVTVSSPANSFPFLTDGLEKKVTQEKSVPGASFARLSVGSGLQKRESSLSGGGSYAGPVLPVDFDRFPVQPNFAILQGKYAACFDAIIKVLTDKGAGFSVDKVDRDEGLVCCSLDSVKDSAFNLALWQLPNDQLLLELIVLSAESNHSWGDTFDRLCSHGAIRHYVLSRQHALNAANVVAALGGAEPIGQFVVKPVF